MNFKTTRRIGMLLGIPILGYASYSLFQAKRSESWPSVPGLVTASEIQQHGRRIPQSGDFAVSFQTQNTSYSCSRVEFGRKSGWRDGFRYSQGAPARVFYDPADPALCVLEPGVGGIIAFELVLGLSFALMAFYSHRKLRARATADAPKTQPTA